MLANHQEIQRSKVNATIDRTKAINKNTDFKIKKLKLKYNI